ncbi:MAG: pyridoxamine 5'-phosphate oxidase family protein [Deltaproteobacteria bacterium]|jgi:uncharacterized pyridoxamine 5'-phosphate oxidase family protein|nr:pyridoxamine 5'-phosphate oxidase family protein [Deltaproteobacteria bacterium]
MSKDVFDFLAANRPFYLATVEGAAPKVRPMGFLMWHEDKIWLGMGDHKNVYKQIKANPKVEIATTNPDSSWLRVFGSLEFVDKPGLFELALETMPQLKDIYPEGGPRMGIGYLKEATAQFVNIRGEVTKTVNF